MTSAIKSIKINESHNLSRENKTKWILSDLVKFAVDSTFNNSLKAVTGPKKLYKIVQERFKYRPVALPLRNCEKPEDAKLAEEMRMKVEEMIQDLAKCKQQNETSAECVEEKEHVRQGPNEGSKKLSVLEREKKRIFIRSRL